VPAAGPFQCWNGMIRGLLLDLEGVLYESGRTIAGTADAARELADAGQESATSPTPPLDLARPSSKA
jgi:hypothetical protein